jgi:spermidine/putrescine transport system substrate-binding protein
MNNFLRNKLYWQSSLLFFLIFFVVLGSFANSSYDDPKLDNAFEKYLLKKYPLAKRVVTKQQIMVAILRANPTAFRGGNVYFFKKINQLIFPEESTIVLISQDEAVKTIKEHYKFFKQKKTGNFPPVPLPRPSVNPERKVKKTNQQVIINKKEAGGKPNKKEAKEIKETEGKPNKKEAKEIKEAGDKPNKKEAKEIKEAENKPNKKEAKEIKEAENKLNKKEEKETADNDINKKPNINKVAFLSATEKKGGSKKTAEVLEQPANKNNFIQVGTAVKKEVTVYNWYDFLPDDILKSFTEETGIKVNYFVYNKEEVMYEEVKALNGRGYDLLVVSAGMVQKMRDNALLQVIDHKNLKGFNHLNPKLLNNFFDPNNEFSIPYLWESIGLVVNIDKLNGRDITSWADLWQKDWKGKLVLYDDMRSLFAVALKVSGYSINSKNADEIKQAYGLLRKIIPNVKKLSSYDELSEDLIKTDASISMIRGSSALRLKQKHSNVRYFNPKEGNIFFVDSFVLPSNAANIDNSYALINYLLRPEVAAGCVIGVNEATPNLAAKEFLSKDIAQDITFFPSPEMFTKAEFIEDVGIMERVYQLYWKKFKQELKSSNNPSL